MRLVAHTFCVLLLLLASVGVADAREHQPNIWGSTKSPERVTVGGGANGGDQAQQGASDNGTPGGPPPRVRTFDCGPPSTGGSGVGNSDQACGFVKNACALAAGSPPPAVGVTTTVTQQQQADGSWLRIGINCAASPGVAGPPPVSAAAVREQVVRLLPAVPVGVAPAAGPTLVNIQTVFWAVTEKDRALGAVTVVGLSVAIRVHLVRAEWDFGDGVTDTVASPGVPYTAGACVTKQCPGLFGHTYVTPGRWTAAATLRWAAEFSVAGGGWEPIPGTVAGPTTTHLVTAVQARSTLVGG